MKSVLCNVHVSIYEPGLIIMFLSTLTPVINTHHENLLFRCIPLFFYFPQAPSLCDDKMASKDGGSSAKQHLPVQDNEVLFTSSGSYICFIILYRHDYMRGRTTVSN